ncbi:MAG: hypothetical protein C0624_00165 [Desulfuromonas sp.]|nr:MAG: hypothetical protein C0624_00165 [Desulfuromonas sp.]
MKRAQDYFSTAEQERIRAAVAAAEQRTAGEIVPQVVEASFDYPRAETFGAGFFALGLATLLSWGFGDSSVWVFLPLFLLGYQPCKWLIRSLPGLHRRLIRPDEMAAEVEEKAMLSFFELGVHRTRERTGILILISLFERRVQLLADEGINAKVSHETWEEVVKTITAGLHNSNACDALCTAIERCAEILEEHFPRRSDDRNELPDLVIE